MYTLRVQCFLTFIDSIYIKHKDLHCTDLQNKPITNPTCRSHPPQDGIKGNGIDKDLKDYKFFCFYVEQKSVTNQYWMSHSWHNDKKVFEKWSKYWCSVKPQFDLSDVNIESGSWLCLCIFWSMNIVKSRQLVTHRLKSTSYNCMKWCLLTINSNTCENCVFLTLHGCWYIVITTSSHENKCV